MAPHPVLDDAFVPELPNRYTGKVRENYDLADGSRAEHAPDIDARQDAADQAENARRAASSAHLQSR